MSHTVTAKQLFTLGRCRTFIIAQVSINQILAFQPSGEPPPLSTSLRRRCSDADIDPWGMEQMLWASRRNFSLSVVRHYTQQERWSSSLASQGCGDITIWRPPNPIPWHCFDHGLRYVTEGARAALRKVCEVRRNWRTGFRRFGTIPKSWGVMFPLLLGVAVWLFDRTANRTRWTAGSFRRCWDKHFFGSCDVWLLKSHIVRWGKQSDPSQTIRQATLPPQIGHLV